MSSEKLIAKASRAMRLGFRGPFLLQLIRLAAAQEEAIIFCSWLYKLTPRELSQVLVDLAATSMLFEGEPGSDILQNISRYNYSAGLRIKWAVEAVATAGDPRHDKLLMAIETALVNGPEPLLSGDGPEQVALVERLCKEREGRLVLHNYVSRFYYYLSLCTLRLKDFPPAEVGDKLRLMMSKANCLLAEFRRQSNTLLRAGLAFPFTDCEEDSPRVVAGVVVDHCQFFCTRTKVPYRVIFETVLEKEFNQLKLELDEGLQFTEEEGGEEGLLTQDIDKLMREAVSSKYSKFKLSVQSVCRKIAVAAREEPARIESFKGYLDEPAADLAGRIRRESAFRDLQSYELRSYIVKGGDDLRQEYFAMSAIRGLAAVLANAGSRCWLRPYEVVIFTDNSGFIEYLWDTKSIDAIKRLSGGCSLREIFHHQFLDNYEQARQNFAASLAGYSLACYLLQIKDRHNGNILLDSNGHIIHIDFGFILGCSPGNAGFESAPFKLTEDYLDLLGGLRPDFERMFVEGLIAASDKADLLLDFCDMLLRIAGVPCREKYDRDELLRRLMVNRPREYIERQARQLISEAADSLTTGMYDRFQLLTNDIRY